MILIAHRGNTNGKVLEQENSPQYLLNAISKGYDVEVDVWVFDNEIYFGHDGPQYKVDEKDFYRICDKAWFHCKNIDALLYFANKFNTLKYFWHENDRFTLTSNGYIWTYPGQIITNKSISVLPNTFSFEITPYAVCSDDFGDINV